MQVKCDLGVSGDSAWAGKCGYLPLNLQCKIVAPLFIKSRCFYSTSVPISSKQVWQLFEKSSLYLEHIQGWSTVNYSTCHALVLVSSLLPCCVMLGQSLSIPGPSNMRELDQRNGLAQNLILC